MNTINPVLPKFRIGNFVLVHQQKTVMDIQKREIVSLRISLDPTKQHQYRVRLFDATCRPYKSPWVLESQISRTSI